MSVASLPRPGSTTPTSLRSGAELPRRRPTPRPARRKGVGVVVAGLEVVRGGRPVLRGVDLVVRPGELVAIAGPSGAGKSTLIEALAGVRATAPGTVTLVDADGAAVPARVGFVPQDDLIHRDLPLRTTLRLAAALRLPHLATDDLHERVETALADLHLVDQAAVRVGDLSGGQRRRASIAAELLARPDVLVLDEPTSGLDPATAGEVLGALDDLTRAGTTVVYTTHHLTDLDRSDRLGYLAASGTIAFVGTAAEARTMLGTEDLSELYRRSDHAPRRGRAQPGPGASAAKEASRAPSARPAVATRRASSRLRGAARQWAVLTRRNVALLTHNRLTLAIVLGSPALVIAMMVVLFPAGDAADPTVHPATAVQSAFWIAFAAFFFGLTAGLLQVVPEAAVVRHEQRAGVGAVAYVAAKVTALLPVVVVVTVGLVVVLDLTERLPTTPGTSAGQTGAVVLLGALSALALGLLTSALVCDVNQATLALPMLCFPQVLFAGAVVAVDDMAGPGWLLSHGMGTRWGFEGIGGALGLATALPPGTSLDGAATTVTTLVVLGGMTVGLLGLVVLAVRRLGRIRG